MAIVDLRKKTASAPREEPRKPATPSVRQANTEMRQRGERRNSALRAKRRRNRLLAIPGVLLLVGGFAFAISQASYMPRFTVSSVAVTGTQDVAPELIRSYILSDLNNDSHPFISHSNIFVYDGNRLAAHIVSLLPRVREVHVSRDTPFSTVLNVSVTERSPFARWCADDTQQECYVIDDGGFAFLRSGDIATSSLATKYVFFGPLVSSVVAPQIGPPGAIGKTFAGAHIAGISALLKNLSLEGYAPLGATVKTDDDFSVQLADGSQVLASFGQNATDLVHNYKLILSSDALVGHQQNLDYVDLRFGDRVYYKLKGSAAASSTAATKPQKAQ